MSARKGTSNVRYMTGSSGMNPMNAISESDAERPILRSRRERVFEQLVILFLLVTSSRRWFDLSTFAQSHDLLFHAGSIRLC